jgi:membrane-bound lytic murein transglycosylase B
MLGIGRRMGLGMIGTLAWLASPAARSAEQSFQAWLAGLRREALDRGVGARTLDAALAGVSPIPKVLEADRRQPEGRMTFAEYRQRVVSPDRVERGRRLLAEHGALLARVEARYGVPAEVMVALWGIESNFGERQGGYSVFAALATLAHDGRRATFFRRELLSALEIADRGHIPVDRMMGSWAGAMGQNQFMPSTYLGYAVDFDGDGDRDIWTSLPDVFGSMANYLARSGWDSRYIWGREVIVPRDLDGADAGLDHRAPLEAWQRRGVRLPGGRGLPDAPIRAALLRMDRGDSESYLVYGNFRALMAWNRSTYFGVSVGLLSDSLKDG